MGMDVYGKEPRNEAGRYFRNNCWWWRPLAEYACEVASHLTEKCEYWQSNDGDGLDDVYSRMLAEFLRNEIAEGRTAQYKKEREERIAKLPRKTCFCCGGTGIRNDEIGVEAGWDKKVVEEEGNPRNGQVGSCNGCGGWGSEPAWEASYPFDVDNVEKFCTFLENCGGFEIN